MAFLRRVALLMLLAGAVAHAAPSGDFVHPNKGFDSKAALAHIRALSVGIGVRRGGSEAERRAADYIIRQMQSWGYTVQRQPVPLPDGQMTENLIFDKPGREDWTWIVGAHKDSKPPSPGANDNGSGVATVLELARDMQGTQLAGGVRLVFFGAEERLGDDPEGHHFGSRFYVAHMSPQDRARCGGMICIDSVAAGPHFVIGSVHGDSPLEKDLRKIALGRRYRVLAQTDPGWSDHAAFEEEGFAVAYIRWRVDPTLHSRGDNYAHVQGWKVATAGTVVLDFLRQHATRYAGPTR